MGMSPEAALGALARASGEAVWVPTMTAMPAWRALAPDAPSVKCAGFMGGASSLGLGLALARPERRVVVLDGDGSLLMQLGSLATVAGAAPRNLTHVVLRNGVYHSSGGQPTPGGAGVDFVRLALAAGYRDAFAVHALADLERRVPELLSTDGPLLVELHVGLARKLPDHDFGAPTFAEEAERLRARLARGG
jgi:phosphonopyruvate decarboxylase